MPARPSSATTDTAGSIRSSRANRCSLLLARSPHASGAACGSNWSAPCCTRPSADCEPARSTTNVFVGAQEAGGCDNWPSRKIASTSSAGTSTVVQPLARVGVDPPTGWCSSASRPRCAALIRSAASFDTTRTAPSRAWPRAAPMMRLSATAGSRPCSINRPRWMPLTSMHTVPPRSSTVSGSASEPPARRRRSSSARRAARADRPTSSWRVFKPSSSSTTVRGTTTAQPAKDARHPGSATRTEVSSTTRSTTPSGTCPVPPPALRSSSSSARNEPHHAASRVEGGGCRSRIRRLRGAARGFRRKYFRIFFWTSREGASAHATRPCADRATPGDRGAGGAPMRRPVAADAPCPMRGSATKPNNRNGFTEFRRWRVSPSHAPRGASTATR